LFFPKYPGIYSVAEKEVCMIRCEFTHIYGRSGAIEAGKKDFDKI